MQLLNRRFSKRRIQFHPSTHRIRNERRKCDETHTHIKHVNSAPAAEQHPARKEASRKPLQVSSIPTLYFFTGLR